MSTIDFEKLRADIRQSYANYKTNGDATLEFEARNADLIADGLVMVMKEKERGTSPADVAAGIAAIAAGALTILADNATSVNRETLCEAFGELVTAYVLNDAATTYTEALIPMKGDA